MQPVQRYQDACPLLLLQDHPLLLLADPAELRMRGPDRQMVFEL
ncbi:hypothetical protein ACFZAU_14260 [Streptomyces sp. NPDC008238]